MLCHQNTQGYARLDLRQWLSPSSQNDRGTIIFASLQTLLSKSNQELKGLLNKTVDLIIVDEIHNFIDNKGSDFINEFVKINPNSRVFGMTATPFQGVVGNLKFVDDIAGDMREIFSKTLPQCIVEGQLAGLNYSIIRSNRPILDLYDFQKGLSELDRDELYLDFSSKEKINAIIQRTMLAKKAYIEKIRNGLSKTLVFCSPARNIVQGFESDEKKVIAFHAKVLAAIFNDEIKDNIDASFTFSNHTKTGQFKDAVYLSSDLPKEERNSILKSFRDLGKPPYVVCTVGMLIEGFDFPELESLILLRPTLSMRLFEQQVGRVIRRTALKARGNIFEIADEVDSLFDRFKEEAFEGKNIERIQMLQPESRLEELLTEGGTVNIGASGKINISEITFNGIVSRFEQTSVEIPPVSLRVRYFRKLLAMVEEKTEGKLNAEKEKLMQMALGIKVYDIESAKQVSKLAGLLDQLEREAAADARLSVNCRRYKPSLYKEVKWLLILRGLTALKIFGRDLGPEEKANILDILGFPGKYEDLGSYRLQCLERSGYGDIHQLSENIDILQMFDQHGYARAHDLLIPFIYLASCFVDYPEIKKIFDSKEWNHNIRNYVIK